MSEARSEPLVLNTGDADHAVPISQAILDGYAPGGELYTLTEFPLITKDDLRLLTDSDYPAVFSHIAGKLLGSAIPDEVLEASAASSYAGGDFDFAEDGNVRLTQLPNGLLAVGLSDGPTASFKDMAMQPLARWMNYLRRQNGRGDLSIMLSTSGDTGPAALAAFAGLPGTEIIAMLPRDGVSLFQRAQMAQYAGIDGVHVLEVDRDFSGINKMHMEADEDFDLTSVNSVNIARIIAQVPYYVASYLKAIKHSGGEIGDPVDVSVPSGNFGNALSAIIARKMGLPLRHIIVATNENNTLAKLFNEGEFELSAFRHTDSSAQDVQMPSNIWRYFAMLFNNNPEKIVRVYKTLMEAGRVAIRNEIGIDDATVWDGVYAQTVHANTRAFSLRDVYVRSLSRIILDPHTANGVAAVAVLGIQDPHVPMLVMETAKPWKFDDTIERIIGGHATRPLRFQGIEDSYGSRPLTRIPDGRALKLYLATSTKARRKQSAG